MTTTTWRILWIPSGLPGTPVACVGRSPARPSTRSAAAGTIHLTRPSLRRGIWPRPDDRGDGLDADELDGERAPPVGPLQAVLPFGHRRAARRDLPLADLPVAELLRDARRLRVVGKRPARPRLGAEPAERELERAGAHLGAEPAVL